MENNISGPDTNRFHTPIVHQTDNLEFTTPNLSTERNSRNLFFTFFLLFALIILNLENRFESNGPVLTSSTVSSSAFYFGEFTMIPGMVNGNKPVLDENYFLSGDESIPITHGSSRWQIDWTKSGSASESAWVSLFIQLDKNGKEYNWNFEKMINANKLETLFEGNTTDVPTGQILNSNFSGCSLEIDVSNDTNLLADIFPSTENMSYRFRGSIFNEKGLMKNQVEYLIKSNECGFQVILTGIPFSMSLFRVNIIHFSFLYNLKVLMEIRGGITQILHSNSPVLGSSYVSNTSIPCLVMQVVLDLLESMFILYCSLALPSLLFSSFVLMIIFKWIHIFYVQIRYLFWVWKSNYMQNIPASDMHATSSQFYRRLYFFLFGATFLLIFLFIICDSGEIFNDTANDSNIKNGIFTRSIPYCIYISFFFFLMPQILKDTFANIRNSSLPLHPHFTLTSLIGKAFVPIYAWGYSSSIFNSPIFRRISNIPVYTGNSSLLSTCIFSVCLIQIMLYFFQLKFGPGSLIPPIFRPKPYNYFRLTNKDVQSVILDENTVKTNVHTNDCIRTEFYRDTDTLNIQDENSEIKQSTTDEIELAVFHSGTKCNSFCVICMINVTIFDELNNELCAVCTPCDHIFHQKCLKQWMKIKLECPTCRRSIPPFDIK
ncbi:RING-H2 finger and transmembrane domain-containing protein [Cryptosporidium canis]|uniref:RING-type E3 ubiquitin transferase n=1 Tax=Cryptosporidium canis TaxID=195482 RepID=A0A9D5DEB8_9CRYT|nr:RING-H2 finger and transmembrane domain-containing protein [Cryptosporidium canis]